MGGWPGDWSTLPANIEILVAKLSGLRRHLDASQPKSTLQSLELFENRLSLDEMQACFLAAPDAVNDSPLCQDSCRL